MRKILLTTSALALSTMWLGSVHAADALYEQTPVPEEVLGTHANVGVWLGGIINNYDHEEEGSDFKIDPFAFGGDARALHEFSGGNALQLELMGIAHTKTDEGNDKTGGTHLAVGAHVMNRDDMRAWGGFGGLTHSTHAEEEGEQSMNLFAGVEYARFMNENTFFAQIGGTMDIYSEDDGAEFWGQGIFGRVGARHFWTENDKLEASVGGGFGKTEDNSDSEEDDLKWFQIAAEWEHKFEDNPFSSFLGYQGDYVEVDEASESCCREEVFAHTLKVGLRMAIGPDTLLEQDRIGAGTFQFMDLSRPMMYADELD